MWELIVQGGTDPVTGRHRRVSWVFRGNLRDAKKARAELLTEVGKGRHTGTAATARPRGASDRRRPVGDVSDTHR